MNFLREFKGDIAYIIKGYHYTDKKYLIVSVAIKNGVITTENIGDLKQIRENIFIYDLEEIEPHIGDIYIELNGNCEILQNRTMLNELIQENQIRNVLDDSKLLGIYTLGTN